jgi:hypothetical protein
METETVTPINDAARALMDTSTVGLLDALVQLTHQVHGLTDRSVTTRTRATELRAQRDMVRAEILRRAGGR